VFEKVPVYETEFSIVGPKAKAIQMSDTFEPSLSQDASAIADDVLLALGELAVAAASARRSA
jgi:hypothetical protein